MLIVKQKFLQAGGPSCISQLAVVFV